MGEVLIDTNVIVRFFAKDVPEQFAKSQEFIEQIDKGNAVGLVSILVIDEIIWVLENYYGIKRNEFLPRLAELLALRNIRIIEAKKDLVIKVLEQIQKLNIDFTDVYLANIAEGRDIFSFDKDFGKLK